MGTVFDIKRFAIHDGPGIRTTVFLKGCHLQCGWCHNPESICPTPEHIFRAARCTDCGRCFAACETGALLKEDDRHRVDQQKCTLCGNCAEACPGGALKLSGYEAEVDEVIGQIEKDIVFYDESGGGVTFSGGEPFLQRKFLAEMLTECKARDIHTAVDTTACFPWKTMAEVADSVDLFLVDLKHMDAAQHERHTGVSNEVILENIRRLAASNNRLVIRIPLIPGVNDDERNIAATGEFVSSLGGVAQLDLLPYNEGACDKVARLIDPRRKPSYERHSQSQIERIADDLRKFGLNVTIGGN